MPPEIISAISTWITIILQVASVVTLVYALAKFANKPNVSQNERLAKLEEWQSKVIIRLAEGDERMAELDKSTKITQEALLAMLSHEISGNDIEKLKQAKHKLETYLIQK